jgi:hypothetical protein
LLKTVSPHPSCPAGSAQPISAIQAPVEPAYAVPERVRRLLGSSWLIEGEDPQRYEELLGRVGAAVGPKDIVDWLLIHDVVAITWEIQRSRRHRETVLRMGRMTAMTQILDQSMRRAGGLQDFGRDEELTALASGWLVGDATATKSALALLKQAGFSLNDVSAHSLTVQAVELDRVDQQVQRHEARRDLILQQIERRRAVLAQRLRRATEEVIDAEFVETPVAAGINGHGDEQAAS